MDKEIQKSMSNCNLEIGDWVDIGYRPARVLSVSSDGYVNVSEVYDEISIGCLKPIPITSEILEKNGISRYGFFNVFGINIEENYSSINLRNHDCTIRGKNVTINSRKMLYVHELQNAFRLCNINKEIKL